MALISQRETGKFNLSIGTSLAIEGILGINSNLIIQKPYPIFKCDELWINVKTLIRNIFQSIPTKERERIQYADYQETLYEELKQIVDIVHRETNGHVWIKFYYPSHRSIKSRYPNIQIKGVTSKNSVALAKIEQWILDGSYVTPPFPLEQINLDIDANNQVLIMTHQPIDLLHIRNFTTLGLVESHTGLVKNSYQWYTKLKGCSKEPRIPFNHITLQLFGDSGDEIQPANLRVRQELLNLSETDKWTQNTSVANILSSVARKGSEELKELVSMFA